MFQMCGVFAEFERGMACERVNAGPCAARAEGKRLGRRPIKPSVEERIRELRAERIEPRKARRWGTREAIDRLKHAQILEDSAALVDAMVLNVGGFTELDFD